MKQIKRIFFCFEKTQSGMTLVEMMVALGISAIIAITVSTFMQQQSQQVKDYKVNAALSTIYQYVEQKLMRPEVLLSTADNGNSPGNVALRACVYERFSPDGAYVNCPETATDPERQLSLQIVLPMPEAATNLSKYMIAGTDDIPARYSLRTGKLCSSAEPTGSCQLEVKASFWATCPSESGFSGEVAGAVDEAGDNVTAKEGDRTREGNDIRAGIGSTETPKVCKRATTLHFKFQVVHRFAATKNNSSSGKTFKISRKLPSVPPDAVYYRDQKTYQAITVPTSILPNIAYQGSSCGPNFTLVALKDSKAECSCLFPFQLRGVECVASSGVCNRNERYRGVDENGDIICEPVFCEELPMDQGCRTGGWIEEVSPQTLPHAYPENLNTCLVYPPCIIGKNGGNCEDRVNLLCLAFITCCYETNPGD